MRDRPSNHTRWTAQPQFDDAGNLTFDGEHIYTYEAWNCLVGVDGTNGITTTRQPRYDASGNLVDDGYRYIYIYDSRNRLVQVNRRDPGSNLVDHVGTVFAKFSYNALGWRTSAIYDLHDATASGHTQLEGFAGAGGGGTLNLRFLRSPASTPRSWAGHTSPRKSRPSIRDLPFRPAARYEVRKPFDEQCDF